MTNLLLLIHQQKRRLPSAIHHHISWGHYTRHRTHNFTTYFLIYISICPMYICRCKNTPIFYIRTHQFLTILCSMLKSWLVLSSSKVFFNMVFLVPNLPRSLNGIRYMFSIVSCIILGKICSISRLSTPSILIVMISFIFLDALFISFDGLFVSWCIVFYPLLCFFI